MTYDIIYESCPWHTRVSLLDEQGKLLGLHYDDENFTYITGTITLGIVRKIVPALNAAFVDIGDITDGFLPLDTIDDDFKIFEGAKIVSRITKERTAEKGASLNAKVLYDYSKAKNLDAPIVLQKAPNALSRSLMDAGLTPVNVWINDDRFYSEVAEFVAEDKIFTINFHKNEDILEELDEQIESLNSSTFKIEGGAEIIIEQTRAVTTIDIDSSSFTTGKINYKNIPLQVNMLAAKEIVRICNLLDIGGSIIVDFITMPNRQDRKQLHKYLEVCFANRSERKTDVMKMSRYGIIEINREKGNTSLLKKLNLPIYEAGNILLKLWRKQHYKNPVFIKTTHETADILKSRLTTKSSLAYLGVAVTIDVAN